MSKKIMNPQRWRLLILVAAIDIGATVLCIPSYLKEPAEMKSRLLGILVMLFCLAIIFVGILIALWRRFPISDDNKKNQ